MTAARSIPAVVRLLLMVAMGLALALGTGFAQDEKPVYPEWQKPKRCVFGMPYVNGVVEPDEQGTITRILKEVFDRRDLEFEHRSLPYNRVMEGLRAGTIQCSLGLKGLHDMEVVGKTTIAVFNLAVAYRTGDGFTNVEEMKDQRVACMYGFEMQRLLPVPVVVRAGYDLTTSFHLLDRGDVKYILDEERLMREALMETKFPTSEFTIHRLMSLEVHTIFTPSPLGREFRALYDSRMEDLAYDGKLRELYRTSGMSEANIDQLFKLNNF